jgi:hypothetical protein
MKLGMRLGTFENRSSMCGHRLKRIQIQSAWREPCDLPRLKPPTGIARSGMGKSPVGCEIGISAGGWLVRSKIKEMSQPKRLFSFQYELHAQKLR